MKILNKILFIIIPLLVISSATAQEFKDIAGQVIENTVVKNDEDGDKNDNQEFKYYLSDTSEKTVTNSVNITETKSKRPSYDEYTSNIQEGVKEQVIDNIVVQNKEDGDKNDKNDIYTIFIDDTDDDVYHTVPSQRFGTEKSENISVDLETLYNYEKENNAANPHKDARVPAYTAPFEEEVRVINSTVGSEWQETINEIKETVKKSSNKDALITPIHKRIEMNKGAFVYPYSVNSRYLVFTTPDKISAIHLQPGEKIKGEPIISGSNIFKVQIISSGESKNPSPIIAISPTAANADGGMLIATNRRSYQFVLISTKDFATEIIRFRYKKEKQVDIPDGLVYTGNTNPNSKKQPLQKPSNQVTYGTENDNKNQFLRKIIPSELNFDYDIIDPCETEELTCTEFQSAQIKKMIPQYAYNDGERTTIGYHHSVKSPQAPAMFLRKDGLLTPLSYYNEGERLVVRSIFEEAVLMLGPNRYVVIRSVNE